MKTCWIIENFTKETSYTNLINEVRRQEFPLLEIRSGYERKDLESIPFNSPVMFQGSLEMAKLIKNELSHRGCSPICYSTFDKYLCSKYYSYFGELLFNDKYAIATLKELNRNKYFYWGTFGKEAMIFIRPDSGEKTFQAQLLDLLDLERFIERYKHLEHELVLVSTPKTIRGEWRFVVSKYKEILGYSLYQYQGQITKIPSAPPQAIDFVKSLLNIEYFPDSVFCMDIAENNDGEFNLLELTSFSSAGLYASKMDLIVKRVSKIAEQDFVLSKNVK